MAIFYEIINFPIKNEFIAPIIKFDGTFDPDRIIVVLH